MEYLKAALQSLDDPRDCAAGLLALRRVAESLYRALSPKGNPTLKTPLAVLRTVGLRLSVESETRIGA